MFTRADYLNANREEQPAAHRRYYGEIIETVGGQKRFHLPFTIEEIRAAIAAGDTHLNTLPLNKWDSATHYQSVAYGNALRERGDYPTLGNGVCLLKEAARLRAEETADAQ